MHPLATRLIVDANDANHHLAKQVIVGSSHDDPKKCAGRHLAIEQQSNSVLRNVEDGSEEVIGNRDWLASCRETARAANPIPTVTDLRFVGHGNPAS